ncbi:MAG: NAD(P)/FAD-dependent oxidoreductase [Rhodoferax sp.]|nr:NAD(P)/FAD-dependent oxidoreductase [Rhodoferax sp.]
MSTIEVAIIGVGFGGLCAAVRLRAAGVASLVVLERSGEVGGTWRDNTYPGCACDVPSHLYSLSFEPNRRWTRPYSQQPEIQAYLRRVVQQYGLDAVIRFGHEVSALRWDASAQHWQIELAGQPMLQARHVIVATGPLNKPLLPNVPGLDAFDGPAFHTSQWRHDVDLRGKRIAVVGTGASAVQVVPEIAPHAAHLTVFQRTPGWVLPRRDRPYGPLRRWLYAHVPGLQTLVRWRIYWFNEWIGMGFLGSARMQALLRRLALQHLRRQVKDAALRTALTPDFNPGCKRLLFSNTWFRALQQPNVSLVTQAVARVTPQGVVGSDGTLHPCDVIIWGTGFRATEFITPLRVYGEQGEELSERWRAQPAATRLGITVAGFPNLFMLVGPNTGLGHNSIIFMIEAQVYYIVDALRSLRRRGQTLLRLRPEAQANSYAATQQKMKTTVWSSGCHSWYQNADGRIDTLWPGFTWEYWRQTRRFDPAHYEGAEGAPR